MNRILDRYVLKDLAGPFAIAAMDPLDLRGGMIESSVLVGEVVDVTVALEAAGDILGTVFAADGTTPVPNIRVRLRPTNRQLTTAANGTFRFDMVPIARSPYTLEAFEVNGTLRATATSIVLSTNAEQVTRDLVLSGLGCAPELTVDRSQGQMGTQNIGVAAEILLQRGNGLLRPPGQVIGSAYAA